MIVDLKTYLRLGTVGMVSDGVGLLSFEHSMQLYTTIDSVSTRRYSQVVTATDSNYLIICSSLRAQVQILLASLSFPETNKLPITFSPLLKFKISVDLRPSGLEDREPESPSI